MRLSPIEETASTPFGDYIRIHSVLGSTGSRADLAQRLMAVFPNAPSKTIKSHIADWCKKLSGQASLQELNADAITEDDLSILRKRFGGAGVPFHHAGGASRASIPTDPPAGGPPCWGQPGGTCARKCAYRPPPRDEASSYPDAVRFRCASSNACSCVCRSTVFLGNETGSLGNGWQ